MRPHGIPIAFIDTSFQQSWGVHVSSDDEQGCHLAIEHLVELGHKRIAFIGGKVGRGMAISRDQFYRQAMRKQGLEVCEEYVRHGHWNAWIAKQCALEILGLPVRPTAIFCASDEMALGVQKAARQLDLQMPRDLSLVGFSNMGVAELGHPALTTIDQPKHEMGKVAVRFLLERMQDHSSQQGSDKATNINLPTRIVMRDSTAMAPTE